MDNQIILEGSPVEIGRKHGELLRDEINDVLRSYLSMWSIPKWEIPQAVKGFKTSTKREFPHLAEEINGIAEGSRIPEDYIYAINARTELLSGCSMLECTAVGIPSYTKVGTDVVLGQNWDWINYFRNLTRVVEMRPSDSPRIKMLLEPGMVGKIGMNETGVGVCLNFLDTYQTKKEGLPVHVLLRGILECADYKSAEELVLGAKRAASANYLIGDRNNNLGSAETSPESVNVLSGKPFVAHTNSFNANGEVCLRQKKFEEALLGYIRKDGNISPKGLKDSFSLPGIQFPSFIEGDVETIHTIIMNLTKGRFLVSEGARSNRFRIYEF